MVPKRRHNVPEAVDEAVVTSIVFGLRALAGTVAFNASVSATELGRIERFVESNPLADRGLDDVRSRLRKRITEFTEEIDDYFSGIEHSSERSSKRIGVGVYYYEDD